MKLGLRFGALEPQRNINWRQQVTDFPYLVLYKGNKYEFIMYGDDNTKQVDYICHFGELKSTNPAWNKKFEDISRYLDDGPNKCECGAIYSSFPWDHMRFCKQWSKW